MGQFRAPELGTTFTRRIDGSLQTALVRNKNPRTLSQSYQRLKMPNLANVYKAAKVALKDAFEDQYASLFAELVRYNLTANKMPVGITKGFKQSGAAVVMPYVISQGSLEAIQVNGQNTNIALAGISKIDADTTVGAFADAVVNGNPGIYQYGDRIIFIEFVQYVVKGMPKVSVSYAAITLEKDSVRTLASLPSLKGFHYSDGYLGLSGAEAVGGFAYIHSRRDQVTEQLLLSPATIQVNNDILIDRYTAADALREAAASYGSNMEAPAVVDPTSAKTRRVARLFGIDLSEVVGANGGAIDGIMSIEYDGKLYMEGDEAPIMDIEAAPQLKINVSDGSKLAGSVQVRVNGTQLTTPTKLGNTITATIPGTLDGMDVAQVVIADPMHTWKLEF